MEPTTLPTRWVGLDLHKEYLLVIGVNQARQPIFGPARVPIGQLEAWARKHLTKQDAVILEMTTNAWQVLRPAAAAGALGDRGPPTPRGADC